MAEVGLIVGTVEKTLKNGPQLAPGKFSGLSTYSTKFLYSHNICLHKKLNIH